MTVKQRTELDKAIERATKAGLDVVGHGHLKEHPEVRIFGVPSQSEPNRWHIVRLYGKHLVCDCRSRVICAHRAVVHLHLVVEDSMKAAFVAEVERAFEEDAQATMTPASLARDLSTYSPKPADDTKAFSLFK